MFFAIGFDIAALLVCVSLGIVLFADKILPTKQNLQYKNMLLLTIVSASSAIASNVLYANPRFLRTPVLLALCLLNYLSFNLISCAYAKFIIYSVKSMSERTLFEKIVTSVPAVLVVIFSVPPAFLKTYAFTPETLRDTISNYCLYIIAAFNIVFGLVYGIKYRSAMERQRVAILCVYTALVFLIVAVNVIWGVLVLNFGVSLGLIFIMLTVQDPNAMLDVSTKSFNAKALDVLAKEWISTKKKFSVAGILVRNLDYINGQYGIDVGTKALGQIAPRLRNVASDAFVFHSQEPAFAVLSDGITERRLSDVAEKLSDELFVNGMNIRLNVGSFIIDYPKIFQTEKQMYAIINFMIDNAYQSHDKKVLVADGALLEKFIFEESVSAAITRAVRDKSFQVYYQPILNQKTGVFDTAEALARLSTDELGFIPPSSFIPKAEQSGEIIEIGKIILDKVCKFIAAHNPEKYGVKNIKVNLSVVQCMQNKMGGELISIIDSYGINHNAINFEITESLADSGDSFFAKNIADLRGAGFKFSLDDYGTGYSNLTRMISFHFDVLKLDKSIVWMAEKKREAMVSLRGTVDIANGIDMAVLAEGIETENQAGFLRDAGVSYFQGYLYSKPIPENDYLEFLKANAK